jgi:hypothetical protein
MPAARNLSDSYERNTSDLRVISVSDAPARIRSIAAASVSGVVEVVRNANVSVTMPVSSAAAISPLMCTSMRRSSFRMISADEDACGSTTFTVPNMVLVT